MDLPRASHDNQPPRGRPENLVRARGTRRGVMSKYWRRPQISTVRSRLTMVLVRVGLGAVIAAGALAQGTGKSSLIGKLEGPEVVTDPAKFPKTFKEAPQLAELVKAGKLPPVAERIGQDPLAIMTLSGCCNMSGWWHV